MVHTYVKFLVFGKTHVLIEFCPNTRLRKVHLLYYTSFVPNYKKKNVFSFDVFGLEKVQMYGITNLQIEAFAFHGKFYIGKCDRLAFDGLNVKPNTLCFKL